MVRVSAAVGTGGWGQGDVCSCDGLMVGEGAQKQRTHTSTKRMHTNTVWGQRGEGRKIWARLLGDSEKKKKRSQIDFAAQHLAPELTPCGTTAAATDPAAPLFLF